MRKCGAMKKDQGVTKGTEITSRESMNKKHFPIIPYSHGEGLIKLAAGCNTPSQPLRASGLGMTQAVGEHNNSRRKE